MLYGLLDENQKTRLAEGYDIDFALETPDHNRQRVNVFRQQGKIAATIRLLNSHIPTLEELHMPKLLYKLAEEPRGLILVTGPTGSGKSTTLAAMIEHINQTRAEHVITIEDYRVHVSEQNGPDPSEGDGKRCCGFCLCTAQCAA